VPHFGLLLYAFASDALFSMISQLLLPDADATRDLGAQIAARLQGGDVVLLCGELGAGKTTLVQGLAQALGVKSEVSSPTFTLIHEHEGQWPLLHLDAYRLENLAWDELRDAGLEDFLARGDAVRLIEWPAMIEAWLPEPRLSVQLEIEGETRRAELNWRDE
jgi:tRNA threonylcarbamoyladenosine biosynthesis protein TsaE